MGIGGTNCFLLGGRYSFVAGLVYVDVGLVLVYTQDVTRLSATYVCDYIYTHDGMFVCLIALCLSLASSNGGWSVSVSYVCVYVLYSTQQVQLQLP
jgi:hypothetical protein